MLLLTDCWRVTGGVCSWTFVLASDPAAAVDTRELQALTAEALLTKIRGIINERGHHAIRGLGRSFRIMDDRGDGKLDRCVCVASAGGAVCACVSRAQWL
jgi:hypothetical protein